MAFDLFYDKLNTRIHLADSLEELIVWKHRVSIGNCGLPFKQKNGYLVLHKYNKSKPPLTKEVVFC